MMIESVDPDLDAHRGAPDKTPERRLATLEAAGELHIPFTTGILVGIGDTRADQLAGLEAIAASHARHGHVQEVIVQNFLPKLRTAMKGVRACPSDDYLWTVAAARLILPPDIHLQAPPNLSDDFGALLDAGIDDWGGVSPVTADHVNPERPWPDLDRLREVTEAKGHVLAPRLTVYPEFVRRPRPLARPRTALPGDGPRRRRVARSRRPRPVLAGEDDRRRHGRRRRRVRARRPPLDGLVLGRRQRAADARAGAANDRSAAPWPTCSPASTPARSPASTRSSPCSAPVAPRWSPSRRSPTASAASIVGDTLTWVANRNINYTNVCTFKCKFCGFSKGPLSLNLRGTPYLLTLDDIAERAQGGLGSRRHRGDAAGRHPPRLRRRLLHRRDQGGEGRRARHARPRLHRARGDRGREAARRGPRRPTCSGSRTSGSRRCPAPRRRSSTTRSERSCAPTRSTPRSGSRRIAPRIRSGCTRTSR